LDDGLLLRRINLRQIIPIPGTKMHQMGNKIVSRNKREFQRFKRQVRKNIERPLLKRILPDGTVLRDVFTEKHRGKLTYCRQIGSYPLLIGIPGVLPLRANLDVKVTDYGYRSVTAFPFPLNINTAQRETIKALPNVGKKRAIRILAKRPFKDRKHFIDSLDDPDVGNKILDYISFK
ncbi:MAG: radical SAM protein, partial [Candidatus Thermoplasmatota archaeon]|nr:radical SAM protein [Candidatus Thermoplasmatota archaeon]